MGCTKMMCHHGDHDDIRYAPCVVKGISYDHGDSFKDDCNSCECVNGNPLCTKKFCGGNPEGDHNDQLIPPGVNPYGNPEGPNDQLIPPGVHPYGNPEGPNDLLIPPGVNPYGRPDSNPNGKPDESASGMSTPSATSCKYIDKDGKFAEVTVGQDFEDACRRCKCQPGGVHGCTNHGCWDKCPWDKNGVKSYVKVGVTFNDGCNDCTCEEGMYENEFACTKKACSSEHDMNRSGKPEIPPYELMMIR